MTRTPLQLSQRSRVVLIVLTSLLFILMLFRAQDSPNTNPASRYATIESLVHRGTFVINDSPFGGTQDRVKVGENYYSSKPPLLPFVSAGVYWLYFKLSGNHLRLSGPALKHLNIVLMVLPYFILVFFFFRFLRLSMSHEKALVYAFAVFLLNCLAAGYATDMNNHSPAALVLFLGYYYAYLLRNSHSDKMKHWMLAGFFSGLLPTLEIPGAAISGLLFLYLLSFNYKKTLSYFLPLALLPLLGAGYLTYMILGSPLPAYFRPELYDYPGSYWVDGREKGMDALREPKPVYLFHMLFGHHGVLTMTPVFFLALAQLISIIRRKAKEHLEAKMILSCFCLLILAYMVKTHNYGGNCVGFRWMVFYMPLLFVFVARWLEENYSKAGYGVYLMVLLGFLTLNKATLDPWSKSYWHRAVDAMGIGSNLNSD